MSRRLRVAGGGPAGSAAVLSASQSGATVELVERSQFPKHKVCGEFLSPGIAPVLRRLGLMDAFEAAKPARIDAVSIYIGGNHRSSRLPQAAYGLSRFAFDQILRSAARTASTPLTGQPSTVIHATGRATSGSPPRGERLFGFKAHFGGPQTSAVELYFFNGCYVGLNAIEGGRTNVCGLGPESALRQFDIDALLKSSSALGERVRPLHRCMDWLFVGPLVFQHNLDHRPDEANWLTGDALSFVDPFTGSGLFAALVTGELAGRYAAEGRSADEYLAACRKALGRPFAFSSMLRRMAGTAVAERLIPWVPATWLFHLTRPAA